MTETPTACCHDTFEWFDTSTNICPGCQAFKPNWINRAMEATIRLEKAVRTAGSDRIGVQILGDAADIIDGERDQNYGDASTNFSRIAALWSTILGTAVTPQQVALCMTGLKIARLIETPDHRDSWTDAAGYIALGAETALIDDHDDHVRVAVANAHDVNLRADMHDITITGDPGDIVDALARNSRTRKVTR